MRPVFSNSSTNRTTSFSAGGLSITTQRGQLTEFLPPALDGRPPARREVGNADESPPARRVTQVKRAAWS